MLTPQEIDQLYSIDKIIVYKHGLVVKRKARYPQTKNSPPPRNGVTEMSKKSKLKLTFIVQNCEIGFKSMFTLTYGDVFIPWDGRELKRQVNVFLKSFRQRFEQKYIWFLEFTKKDRPHLHVITTVSPNEFDRVWLGQRWSEISVRGAYSALQRQMEKTEGNEFIPIDPWVIEDEQAKVFRVHSNPKCWERIKKNNGAMRYCLKYATKQEQKLVPVGFANVGRFWGTSQEMYIRPIGVVKVGEDMSEAEVREMFSQHRVGDLPLIPRYIFETDAWQFFTKRGLRLNKFFTKPVQDIDTNSTKV